MSRNPEIQKGEILILTNGSYSDYCIMMSAKSLCGFDMKEVAESFRKIDSTGEGDMQDKFIRYLLDNEYIEEIDCREHNIDDYGIWF